MMLLDAKGRLFGKINIIDALIVLIVTVIILAGIRFIFIGREQQWINIGVISNNQPYWVVEKLRKGDEIVDRSGKIVARINDITVKKTGNDILYNLEFDVDLLTDRTYIGGKIAYNKKQILVGSTIDLETNMTLVRGSVSRIGSEPKRELVKKNVRVLLEHREQWIADALFVGEQERDSDGNVLAQITNKRVLPSEETYLGVDATGGLLANDLSRLDIYLDIDVYAQKRGTALMYHDVQLLVGKWLPFYFDTITIGGEVISIES